MAATATETQSTDEQRLAELGYTQDLRRGWSRFSNFAISFTIISVLAGPFTTFFQAWNNGGPVAISIGWPIISLFVLVVALSMAELASAYPTAGGIYYWAHQLGGKTWAWFTGWFNLIGLVAIVASVDYAAATFLNVLLGLYNPHFIFNWATTKPQDVLYHTFALFLVILAVHTVLNIFSSPLVALFNRISVWWHVLGVAAIVAILFAVPDHHQNFGFVFGHRLNLGANGFAPFSHGSAVGGFYWFYVLPLGFLLTMYTFTGYDASAHISEETHGADQSAPKGIWRSVFYSAVIGWIVLLAITFAATHVSTINAAGGTSTSVFTSALGSGWAKAVILIATVGQIFCGMGCVTAASRMTYAFSRDGAVPGHRIWRSLNRHRTPTWAVVFVAAFALIITLPALKGTHAGITVAFTAVTTITTIGLYIAYTIPVYLRWRKGDGFQPGPWNLGRRYRWMNAIAILWVAIYVVIGSLPFVPAGVPFNRHFSWSAVNYAPLVTFGVIIAVGIWWMVSARKTFTGPIRTIDLHGEGMEVAPEGGPAGRVTGAG